MLENVKPARLNAPASRPLNPPVTDVQLFYFAGGWIRFRATEGHLLADT